MTNRNNLCLLSLISLSLLACSTVKPNASTSNSYINSANILLKQSQTVVALESANMAIKQDPHNGYAYLVQAKAYQQLQQFKSAENSYLRAINEDDENVEFRTAYASFFCATQDYSQADVNYHKALKIAGNNESGLNLVYINRGDCYTSQNNLESAIDSYSQVLGKPNPPLAAYLGITYAYILQNNYPRASYFISSYDGPATPELLQMKITALSGLQSANLSPKNRKILANRIKQLKQQLKDLSPETTDETIAITSNSKVSQTPVITVKPNSVETTSVKNSKPMQAISNTSPTVTTVKTVNSNSPTKTTPPTKIKVNSVTSNFKSRIKTSSTDRHYVVIEKGDTLYNIAEKSHVPSTKLIKLNHLKTDYVPLDTKFFLD